MVISIDTRLKYLLDHNHILFILIKNLFKWNVFKNFLQGSKKITLNATKGDLPVEETGSWNQIGWQVQKFGM